MTKYDIPEDHPHHSFSNRPIYIGDRVLATSSALATVAGMSGRVIGISLTGITIVFDNGTTVTAGRRDIRWQEPKPKVTADKVTLSDQVHERIMNGQATDADLIALQAAWIEAMAPAAEPDPMYATGNGWGRD